MKTWLNKLGYTDERINGLNIVHVAGTKGKGSTCAFVESFLRAHGRRTGATQKVGLYTSPHLIELNERIRINFDPLPQHIFAQYAFEVRDGLDIQPTDPRPRYLQLLALISFHAFFKEGVDVAIYETHHGGEFCATNVVQHPVVTGITSIGMDHVHDLGPTVENIAWHKAGIFKTGTPAFSQPQTVEVTEVLQQQAAKKGVDLKFVTAHDTFPSSLQEEQLMNASLAREITDCFLESKYPDAPALTSQDIHDGVQQFSWPGRFQTVSDGKYLWCLDGAHNEISIEKAALWFQRLSRRVGVLKRLAASINVEINHAIFTKFEDNEKDQALLNEFGKCWTDTFPETKVWSDFTHGQVMARVEELGKGAQDVDVLVTGSLHLVGSILRCLSKEAGDNMRERH
ncbi:folylpolyglutamate synthase [Sporothrix brasiliensis 5110]|uniref:tetrahydrofolate synthase n=1 Tax=Sporothrix brasiliensis 5110 TaxID=1398154 RepID=A0A0C2F7G6_9PEZI|nr:folylpolyglutamate synthase [Sporothrix brasiliensis 5110]KIH94914.1 folylpolyglutamate synthase [Sporothrix brasiliensis 5110]